MAIAYHLVFGCYGFWLPNDPRGSWSQYIGSRKLLDFGAATKVDTRHSLAGRKHDNDFRFQAKESLKYPPVKIDGHQALAVVRGIEAAKLQSKYQIFALCVMPDHVHTVIAMHDNEPKQIMSHFKSKATQRLTEENRHPMAQYPGKPTPWGRGGWCVFLDKEDDVKRALDYVEQNPIKEGLRRQTLQVVEPYPPLPPPF